MKCFLPAVVVASFVFTGPVSAQVLFNNGVVRGGAGAFGLTTDPGAGFNGSDASQANPEFAYAAGAPAYADDFFLSSDSIVTSLTVYTYVPNSTNLISPFTSTSIDIWNGQPGSGASIIASSSNQVSSVFSNVYRTRSGVGDEGLLGSTRPIFATTVAFSNLSLNAGNYWFSFSQGGSDNIFVPGLSTVVNTVPQLIPGNALAFDANQVIPWVTFYTARLDRTAAVQTELPFLVNGTATAPEPGSLLLAILPVIGSLIAVRCRHLNA